jgi:hypothetical protein
MSFKDIGNLKSSIPVIQIINEFTRKNTYASQSKYEKHFTQLRMMNVSSYVK